MSTYIAPLKDIRFVIKELADLEGLTRMPGGEEITPEVVDAILEQAARFASCVLAPLNRSGDLEGAHWHDRQVTSPRGFKEAYRWFVDNGWSALSCRPEHGGQGLPRLVAAAVSEMWKSANHAFSLCPMLTMGAIEALELCGNPEQKALYLPKMVSGEWTGTMNITEPQAGSDLAAIRTRAEPQGDGSYRIFGQKIFITWGDHDMTDNIVHLVLARTSNAPEGVKGISLFVVPKFLVNADGSLGERNDAWCVSVEKKLGIHASPTCVMAFGDNGGAIGTLVGQENEGLKYMFIMMNAARFAVGLEGLAVAEAAYQKALSYARERIQSRAIEGSTEPIAIVHHPDVRRMLMTMKSKVEAMRALAYRVAGIQDLAQRHADQEERFRNQALVDLLTPVVKGWLTETGNEVASLGVQIHGGMGFIEEAGAAQYFRDARITTIYEGTTGIQANDLIGRKIARDDGVTMKVLLEQMKQTWSETARQTDPEFAVIADALAEGIVAVEEAVNYIVAGYLDDLRSVAAGAVPFLNLMGIVCGGWSMALAALAAKAHIDGGNRDDFYPAKITTACFFATHILPQAPALARVVLQGGSSTLALPESMF
ncbi:3-methylmercaptopropionyl-CoA dehydrogenase [Georgfuchsia toluolica]|uniref:3-methylmercaptopropionyl-CoA dehydrogenase n=1 Tax=Georgfuchsia toluolica TaxID=424218 RepID=A0A916J804_9PROT|nr:acyl-CoA dehydrogenase [Georgfuchsia toluolica]CAG4885165.1 3-methylmercaptopropionyl-CoA dehydrogenase [Georgfuchsia toluolica]